jgi:hypothetical protein
MRTFFAAFVVVFVTCVIAYSLAGFFSEWTAPLVRALGG